ncbi:hypothetical protein K474DRAFT_1315647 [Panus rudis PR-1116 ss-1]|nr:hypothetical protein K474DRAFT_1315647 [Panus rudis PR-1116 ss-1]
MNLRLFEEDEREAKRYMYVPLDEREHTCQVRPSERYFDPVANCRIRRFFGTFRGFYTGDLDMTGRHLRRYQSIVRRFTQFTTEFCSVVSKHGKLETRDEYDILGRSTVAVTDYKFNPVEPYDDFLLKWECSGAMSAMEIYDEIVNLPPELLIMVMEYLDVSDALRFGSTCRLLREISFPYLYSSRAIQLHWTTPDARFLNRLEELDNPEEELLQYHTRRYVASQEKLIKELTFLRNCPDIVQKLKRLSLIDNWVVYRGIRNVAEADEYVQANRVSISTLLPDVLSRLANLQSLVISCWRITQRDLESISSMPRLHTLDLRDCMSSFAATTTLPRVPCTKNLFLLHFHNGYEAVLSQWSIPGMFTSLQHLTFSITSTQDHFEPSIPTAEFTTVVNLFKTLKTVIFDGLLPIDVQSISAWVSLANGPLPLERFKLVVNGGLNRREILDLLNALSHSRLKYLVIDGIRWADPVILDTIAQTFPQLESLVLHYRQNDIQYRCKAALWPCPTWEYAAHLTNFQCLRYFGWNFRVGKAYFPRPTLLFPDEGYAEEVDWRKREQDKDEEGLFIADLLHVHCPTLQLVAFYTDSTIIGSICCGRVDTLDKPRFDHKRFGYCGQQCVYDPHAPHDDVGT